MQSSPFFFSHPLAVTCFIKHSDGHNYAIQIICDVAGVNDGSFNLDGTPHFEVAFKPTSIITPASSKNIQSQFPLKFPELFIVRSISSFDEHTYEMDFEVRIISISLSENRDIVSIMPQVTAKFEFTCFPINAVKGKIDSNFYCSYCNHYIVYPIIRTGAKQN